MIKLTLANGAVVSDPALISELFASAGVIEVVLELGATIGDANFGIIDGHFDRQIKREGAQAVEFEKIQVRGLRAEHVLPADCPLPAVVVLLPLEVARQVGEKMAEGRLEVVKSLSGLVLPPRVG